MKQLTGLLMLLLTLTLQACLSSSLALKVSPDGSGRAVITSRLYEQGMRQLEASLSIAPTGGSVEETLPPPSVEELSSAFGTTVQLESTTLENTADGVIRTTIVTFPDIKQVRLQFPPVVALPAGTTIGMNDVADAPLITFDMRPHENGDRLLLVRMPDSRMETDPTQPQGGVQSDLPLDRNFRRAIKGMSLQLSVELEVPLLRTNAPDSSGNNAIILNVDVPRVIDSLSEDKLRRVMTPGSVQELLWQIGDLPGATLPTDREVFLEFEPPPAPPAQQAPAQQPARPDTEVFLAPLTIANGRIDVGQPVNISRSAGYDNQPSFTRDGESILFTSVRGGGTQSDIYRYDIASSGLVQVTNTPESEYSPTITPAGNLSVVRVELDKDNTQRLWQFTADGRDARVVLESIKPVGYHAWADDHTLALFILGEPATLQVADTRTGTARVVASDIGRSLWAIPGGRTISFVQRERSAVGTRLLIKELDPATGETRTLTSAVGGGDEADVAWTPDGRLLMARDEALYAWRRGDTEWRLVAALGRMGLKRVSRIAVSPRGDRIALVGAP